MIVSDKENDSERFCQCDPYICSPNGGYNDDDNTLDCYCCDKGYAFWSLEKCSPVYFDIQFIQDFEKAPQKIKESFKGSEVPVIFKIDSPFPINDIAELVNKAVKRSTLSCYITAGGPSKVVSPGQISYKVSTFTMNLDGMSYFWYVMKHEGTTALTCTMDISIPSWPSEFSLKEYIALEFIKTKRAFFELPEFDGVGGVTEEEAEKVHVITTGMQTIQGGMGAAGAGAAGLSGFGALALLWNVLELMQLVDVIKYIDLVFPPNVNSFFDTLDVYNFEFIQDLVLPCKLDVGDLLSEGASIRNDLFFNCNKLANDNQTPDNFMGDDKTANFVINMGNVIFITLVGMIIQFFTFLLLKLACLKEGGKCKKFFTGLDSSFKFSFYIRIVLETDLAIALFCALQIRFFSIGNRGTYGTTWQDGFDVLSLLLGVAVFVFVVALPFLYARFAIKLHNAREEDPEGQLVAKYIEFIEVLREDVNSIRNYLFLSTSRRVFVGIIVSMLNPWPLTSLILISFWPPIMFLFIFVYRPFKKATMTILNLVDELMILLVYFGLIYLAYAKATYTYLTIEEQKAIGWYILTFINIALATQGILFVVELVVSIIQVSKKCYKKLRAYLDKKKSQEVEMTDVRNETKGSDEFSIDRDILSVNIGSSKPGKEIVRKEDFDENRKRDMSQEEYEMAKIKYLNYQSAKILKNLEDSDDDGDDIPTKKQRGKAQHKDSMDSEAESAESKFRKGVEGVQSRIEYLRAFYDKQKY